MAKRKSEWKFESLDLRFDELHGKGSLKEREKDD